MLLYSKITHVRAGLWEFLTKQFDVSGSEGLFGEHSEGGPPLWKMVKNAGWLSEYRGFTRKCLYGLPSISQFKWQFFF